MRKDDALKHRLDDLFSPEVIDSNEEIENPLFVSPEKTRRKPLEYLRNEDDTTVQVVLTRRIQELDCLNEIGYRIDEKPEIDDFLTWTANRLPKAMQDPKNSTAAITFEDKVYGNPKTLNLPSKIVAGLRINGKLLGYIHLAYLIEQKFLDEESAFIGAVAGRVAGYLENQYLIQQMQKRSLELSTLNEMSQSLTSSLSIEQIAQLIYQFTARLMGVVDFYVAYYDELDQTVNFVYLFLNGQPIEPFSRPLGNGLTDRIIKDRTPILLSDNVIEGMKELGIDFIPVGDDKPALSWLGVPIIYEDKILGVISVQTTEKPGLYTENERNLLIAIAQQSAVAMRNTLLFSETRQLYEGSAALVASNSPQEVLDAIINATRISSQYDQAYLLLFDQLWDEIPPELLTVAGAWTKGKPGAKNYVGEIFEGKLMDMVGLSNPQQPTFVQDINIDKRVSPNLRNFISDRIGMKSLALFPLAVRNQYFGVVSIHSKASVTITDAEIRQINSLIGQAATVLQSQQLRENLQRQLHEMEVLQRTLSKQAWRSYLSRRDQEHWGYEYNRVDVTPIGDESSGHNGNGGSPASKLQETTLIAPLEVRGEKIGGLSVPGAVAATLTEEDQNFLNAVAEQVAQALERARLFEQTQKSALELETVAQVSSASSTVLDPQELLQSVVDLAKNSFGLYHAHAYLIDESETKLVLSAGAGDIGRHMVKEGWVIFLSEESIVAQAARNLKGQIVNNVKEDPNFLPNPLLPNTISELAIPMVVGQKLLGVFDVQSDRVNAFTEEDLRTFSTLASQTSIALQNARLFAEQTITVERLRELDHLKTSFLANMSHELRTPLNSILGFTQVILEGIDGPLTDYMVSDLQLIEKNGKHLLNLINEVLDMAKIEAGRMSLTIEPVDLKDLMEDVLETTSAQARDKAIYLDLKAQEMEDYLINGDQMRLRQIMLNLVGNSIKFTETGGITIELIKGSDSVSILVKDTGVGIPEDKLESIFEAFSQVDTSTTRKAGGTGLGLPISRRLVEMHGGKLWAESNGMGEGTIMHMILPIQARTL